VSFSPNLKRCPKCRKEKETEEFHKDKHRKDGLYVYCKSCCTDQQRQHRAKYAKSLAIMEQARNQTPERKESRKKYKKSEKFKKQNRKYEAQRRRENIGFKISANLRGRLYHAIKDGAKGGSAVNDLGCSVDELKKYLEAKFKPGMSWDNWARKGWHIDHIVPLNYFDLSDPKQVVRACHYTNLQPLWYYENGSKGAKCV